MPQEMRDELKRTELANLNIVRILGIYHALNYRELPETIQKWTIDAIWPNITKENRDTVAMIWPYLVDTYESLREINDVN